MTGTQLDHYRILEKLGEGGMGVVYKAIDMNLDRVVAIKLLSSDLAAYPELTERFKSEAKLQATLSHPNVALLYTFFFWEGSPAIVMEFIEGETFQRIVRDGGPVPPAVLLPLFKQALMGVGAAHRHGIVHRDIKPANIMRSRNGLVKVMDFGIAKAVGAGSGLTRTNTAMGTSWYMSPEQVLNRPVDARSDVYALGITLYEMLCGEVPFRASSEFEIQRAHVNMVPAPPTVHCPNIPAHLVAAVSRALEKDPDARFQSVEEFSTALGPISGVFVPSATPIPERRTPVPPSLPPRPPEDEVKAFAPPPPPTPVPIGAQSLGAVPIVSAPPPSTPHPVQKRRSIAPVAIVGTIIGVLALSGFLYLNARAQDRQRAQAEALLSDQQAERERQAAAEKERDSQETAEEQRSAEALKQRIKQEEETANDRQSPSSTAPRTASTSAPDSQDEQENALTQALGGATQRSTARSQAGASGGAVKLAGLWKGTYMCLQQGQNGAELSVSSDGTGSVSAQLTFQVPNARPGSYLMRGIFDPSSGQINLHFTKWIDRPLNYVPANLTGVADLGQGVLRGQVIAPGCGNFELWRSR